MTIRSQFHESRALAMGLVVVFLAVAMSCSRPLSAPAESEVGQAPPPHAPFHEDQEKAANEEADDSTTGSAGDEIQLPFRDRQSLPAGTMISVRLKNPISVGDPEAGNTFEAVVIEPVVRQGNTLIPSGTAVAGLVESARTSTVKANRGYVRLSLASAHMDGVDVPLQTASLFARQFNRADASAAVIYLEKGRRLTFRLTKPVYLANQRAQASH